MSNLIGQSLGRYHILEQLGEGGMATVYKAYDTRLEADVAVKVIRTENLTLGTMERALKRFEREAKALARLTHPNIVKVMDYGEHEGKPYLVMPFLPGGTLKARLGKPIAWQDAVRILLPIANALEYAHEHDIIHRDIKPANILITEKGQPMLSDFGVAKLLDIEETMDLTGTGVGIGTPEYMAPEQGSSKTIDHRTDIYSLGVVFYEMVTGRKPFTADTPLAVLIKRASEPLPRPRSFAPNLPQEVENILFKALAKDPKDRYQNMAEFSKALEGLTGGKAIAQKIATPKNREAPEREKRAEFKIPAIPRRTVITVGLIALGICLLAVFSFFLKSLPAKLFPTTTTTNTPTPIFTATATPNPDEITDEKGVTMRFIPAGEFSMGSNEHGDEKPIHTVYLDDYYIDKYEVTNASYEACVNAGVCDKPKNSTSYTHSSYYGNLEFEDYPVIYVNWNMAKAYCEWRGPSTGSGQADLPSEAQWEKAVRGTDGRTYPWGNESPNDSLLNYGGNTGDTTEVGKYSSGQSVYGVYDMVGNVWEWVADWYDSSYYSNSPSSNPLGPDSGQYRVLRGGSWSGNSLYLRSAYRFRSVPSYTSYYVGFRCSRSP